MTLVQQVNRASMRVVLICLALLIPACQAPTVPISRPQLNYESVDRLVYFTFRGGTGNHGVILPTKKEYDLTGKTAESLGYPLLDCSDVTFVCARTFHSVFAVPRDGRLMTGRQYQVEGARLRVVECLPASEPTCRAALISSSCEVLVPPDGCAMSSGTRKQGDEAQQGTYFVYNQDYGVTSFGMAGAVPAEADEMMRIAQIVSRQYVLQGSLGLLKAEAQKQRE